MNTFNIMVLIMLEQSEQIIDSLSSVMIYALVGGILIIIFLSVINNILTKSEIKNLTKQLGKIEIARMQTSHELYDYYNAFSDKSLLPFKYSYPGSIEILWDIINDYRANSITDAINLFIEDSHRNKMENIQAGILKENKKLNQTASSAKNWAVASTAVSVLGLLKRD
ncbi:hypothetical protein Awo_c11100 [Acetobacterium woodii DSM 1030]|uniref:Uncharacterized protein n=2 Tax=Acetobacterium woodii TaxID=33952 RepID=H6LD55_ACEWD|nr:hypothetical protein Awo_c11100 [Acetobacterium woodii DSM 1030]